MIQVLILKWDRPVPQKNRDNFKNKKVPLLREAELFLMNLKKEF